MRVLTIGGTGFIGQHIVRQMAEHGHDVTVYHRGRTTAVLPKVVHEVVDVCSVMPIQKFPKSSSLSLRT